MWDIAVAAAAAAAADNAGGSIGREVKGKRRGEEMWVRVRVDEERERENCLLFVNGIDFDKSNRARVTNWKHFELACPFRNVIQLTSQRDIQYGKTKMILFYYLCQGQHQCKGPQACDRSRFACPMTRKWKPCVGASAGETPSLDLARLRKFQVTCLRNLKVAIVGYS